MTTPYSASVLRTRAAALRLLPFLVCAPLLEAELCHALPPLPGDESGIDLAPPDPITLSAREYPEGAVITGTYYCPLDCAPDQLLFFDPAGAELSGTFLDVSTIRPDLGFAWQSDVPLDAGTYVVQLDGTYDSTSFVVIEGEANGPEISASLTTTTTGIGDPITCAEGVEGVLIYPGVFERATTEALLVLRATGLAATQYDFSVEVDGGPRQDFIATNINSNLGVERRMFCFVVFAAPLDGSPEIALPEQCVDTEPLTELGENQDLFASLDSLLSTCIVPPPGYQEQWCAFFERAFQSHSCDGYRQEACVSARYACDAGDLPEYEHTLQEDDSEKSSSSGENSDQGAKGCSHFPAGSGGSPLPPSLLFLSAAAFASLRRRWHPETKA